MSVLLCGYACGARQARQSQGLPTANMMYGDDDVDYDDNDDGGDDGGDAGGYFDMGGDDFGGHDHSGGGESIDVAAFMAAAAGDGADFGKARSLESVFQAGNTSLTYEDLCKKHIVSASTDGCC